MFTKMLFDGCISSESVECVKGDCGEHAHCRHDNTGPQTCICNHGFEENGQICEGGVILYRVLRYTTDFNINAIRIIYVIYR